MNLYEVIKRPILSEKSTDVREGNRTYTFEVVLNATKADVKKAVEKVWDVKVEKVATLLRRGKVKRRGTSLSKPKNSKRAYVKLVEGSKLPLFEEQ